MPLAPTLPAHGAAIPAIGFGTSGMGDVRAEHIATALKAGYRHIDTARKYGTERAVGEGMRASGVPRAENFLCTKVSHENLHARDFARSVNESLKALGVDYVDLLLVHWPEKNTPLPETMAALAKARRDGLTRHIGVANFNIAMLDAAIGLCPEPLVTLQAECHAYLDQAKGDRGLQGARACAHRLLSARPRPAAGRQGAGRYRAAPRQDFRPGGAALFDAARHDRRHSALVERDAHRREH